MSDEMGDVPSSSAGFSGKTGSMGVGADPNATLSVGVESSIEGLHAAIAQSSHVANAVPLKGVEQCFKFMSDMVPPALSGLENVGIAGAAAAPNVFAVAKFGGGPSRG